MNTIPEVDSDKEASSVYSPKSLNSQGSMSSMAEGMSREDRGKAPADEVSDSEVTLTFGAQESPREPQSPAPSLKLVMPNLQRLAVLPKSPMLDHKMVDNDLAVSPSARMLFSAAQDENALACGSNDEGQLGVGPTEGDFSSELQQLVGPLRWVALSQGENHSAGVDDQGHLFSWGRCRPSTEPEAQIDGPVPKPLNFSLEKDEKVIGLDCGGGHTVALTETRIYAWGDASDGQCATPPEEASLIPMPREITCLAGKYVTQVACGRSHTLCVTATSHVYSWGSNTHGQLGIGSTQSSASPRLVEGLWAMPVRQLAAGDAHSAALAFNGSLFTWGSNGSKQLGLPVVKDKASSSKTSRKSTSKVLSGASQMMLDTLMDMGISKSRAEVALRETGNAGVEVAAEWLFANSSEPGDSDSGAEAPEVPPGPRTDKPGGSGSSSSSNDAGSGQPLLEITRATEAGKAPIKESRASISSDRRSFGVSFKDEKVRAEARAKAKGKAPLPPPSIYKTPHRVPLQAVSFIACGADFSVALTETEAFAWGNGLLGQLGTAQQETAEKPSPLKLPDAPTVVRVACGRSHSLFLTAEGRVFGCGDNSFGQLGMDTDGEPVLVPREVPIEPAKTKEGTASVVNVCTGAYTSGFLLGAASDIMSEQPQTTLRDRLQNAVEEALNSPNTQIMGGFKVHHNALAGLKPHVALFRLLTAIKLVFSSAAAMNAVFGHPSQVGIDVVLLEEVQSKLLGMGNDLVNASLYKSTLYLLDDVYNKMHLLGTADRVQILLASSMNILLGQPKFAAHLLPRLCTVILSASLRHVTCRQLLQKWWAEFPGSILLQRVVHPLQLYLTSELMKLKKLTVNVMNCIKLLDEVFKANLTGRNLDAEDFHNELISEKLDVLDHYIAWRQSRDSPSSGPNSDGPFSFCSYPFLLNNKAKSKLLHTEAKIRMETTVAQARMESNSRRSSSSRQPEDRVLPSGKTRVLMHSPERPSRDSSHSAGPSRLSSASGPAGTSSHHSSGVRGLLDSLFGSEHGASSSSAAASDAGVMASPGSVTGTRSPRRGSRTGSAMDVARRQMASEIHRTTSFRARDIARSNSLNLPPPDSCGVPAQHHDHCILRVRRTHILEDALEEIARQRTKDLLKPLRVHFIGEEGIDAGGVRKEFFQLLVNDLLRPDYGMLEYFEETRVFWFNPNTLEAEEEFMLIGIIMGLAIYNGVLLDLPLPQVLYKKLLKQEVGLRDLEEMQPLLGRSMKQLLQYEGPGSVEDVFCQTFSIDYTAFGVVTTVELKPGGHDIYVTEANRREFVELYVDNVLNLSVKTQFDAFSKGFLMVCGGPALNLFHAQELETLVCGEGRLDFTALRKNARYDGGFNAESVVVSWLWEVLLEFTEEEKQLFLKFFTGSDRAPIGGLGSMRSVIQRDGTDNLKLPTSHTCFNTLLLPEYSSREMLETRLKLAILNAEGFGLE